MVTKVDIEVLLCTSATHPILSSKASLIAYLEVQECRSVGGLAEGVLVVGNWVRLLGSLEVPAVSSHTGGNLGRAGVT